MINKYLVWHKLQSKTYQVGEHSDDSMVTIALFLRDGLGLTSYVNFLEDTYRIKFSGNISDLEKRDTLVTVFIDDYVFPNMPPFTTTIKNLIAILIEFVRLKDLEVNKIIITLNDDVVTISGE